LKIAVLPVPGPVAGQRTVAEETLSRLGPGALPPGTVLLRHRGTLLKTLEAAAGFDGLILVDGASMGKQPAAIMVFSLNDLILPGSRPRVAFDNIDVERDVLYATKFLSLPPLRIVGLASGDDLATGAESFLGAIRQAVSELT